MYVIQFYTELFNAKISSLSLIKSDSTRGTLPAILKILGTLTGNISVESVFSIVIGAILGSSN